MRKIQNHNNVPTITSLVTAGNPKLKALAKKNKASSCHLAELNQRIDEIENAIGQDNSGPVGRAFAIRAESNSKARRKMSFQTEHEVEKN